MLLLRSVLVMRTNSPELLRQCHLRASSPARVDAATYTKDPEKCECPFFLKDPRHHVQVFDGMHEYVEVEMQEQGQTQL